MSGPSRPEGSTAWCVQTCGSWLGYHSPQLDVDVRLNTNESPPASTDGFVDER